MGLISRLYSLDEKNNNEITFSLWSPPKSFMKPEFWLMETRQSWTVNKDSRIGKKKANEQYLHNWKGHKWEKNPQTNWCILSFDIEMLKQDLEGIKQKQNQAILPIELA